MSKYVKELITKDLKERLDGVSEALLVNVVGLDARDIWADQVAPRHSGTVNVLYVDGHVGTHRPAEITPELPVIHNDLWRPMSDPLIPE